MDLPFVSNIKYMIKARLILYIISFIYFIPSSIIAQSQISNIDSFYIQLINAAIERTQHNVTYDPSYCSIDYPDGDIPNNKGVCTDLLIRAYRKAGIDLQKEVHEDMVKNFNTYPQKWGLTRTDKNIDHRRVPNLMTYFTRRGKVLPISNHASVYKPGDIVAWDLGGGITHIGLVTNKKVRGTNRYLIVHNIGAGPQIEDMLFDYEIIGHYRYGR